MQIRAFAAAALTICLARSITAQDKPAAAAVEFPSTTGPYQVGRASYHLVDAARKEIFTAEADDVRELMITVHYPAEVPAGQAASPYADDALAAGLAEAYHKPAAFFKMMHSHAVEGAPVARKEGGYPVVIFSPGFNAHPLFYTATLEELASQGFVVASVCHPYSTGATVFADGRVVRANDEGRRFELTKAKDRGSHEKMINQRDAIGEVWLADVRFVLDSIERLNRDEPLLAGHLDVSRAGIFGHSFGGATAAAAVERDKRFRAGINLDGTDLSTTRGDAIRDSFLWLASMPPDFSKLPPPIIRREGAKTDDAAKASPGVDGPPAAKRPGIVLKGAADPARPPLEASKLRPYNGLRAPADRLITLAGSRHQTFASDVALLKATPGLSQFALGEDLGTIEGGRAVTVVNALVSGFFRQQLRGETVPCLDKDSKEFPEAIRGPAPPPAQ